MGLLKIQSRQPAVRPRIFLYLGLLIVVLYFAALPYTTTSYRTFTSEPSGFDTGSKEKDSSKTTQGKKKEPTEADLIRVRFEEEWKELGNISSAGAIYGNTIASLSKKGESKAKAAGKLTQWSHPTTFSVDEPYVFNPYPDYNSNGWKNTLHADYVPCVGPAGDELADVSVFMGWPHDFPDPKFGAYDTLDIDRNLCYERETKLAQFGLVLQLDADRRLLEWDNVNWGELQRQCGERNKARFGTNGPKNQYLAIYLEESESPADEPSQSNLDNPKAPAADELRSEKPPRHRHKRQRASQFQLLSNNTKAAVDVQQESRTAVLLRSYTGREYTENDKQVIRSLISELSLRSGGEYEVYLLVQVKGKFDHDDLSNKTIHDLVLQDIPLEFQNMTILWNDLQVQSMYPALGTGEQAQVHNAQWLTVQKFAQEHRQYEFVWNWELDSRVIGQHYDLLTKLVNFAKKQPRRGLWERNERFYIPSVHGKYETDFRKHVEEVSGSETVWGPPDLPFIQPIGPKPPVSAPELDDYEWGVDEDADIITVSPIFNPVGTNWILRNQVWSYKDATHDSKDLPRRAAIVTQSRISRRLLDIMHVENLRGNHVGSELETNTVALLHGLKAVYAPMPVFFDRDWSGEALNRWFNSGPKGTSGGNNSAMGWGQEGRYSGSTWYYRADPPQRLYNNWLGYEDTGIGGEAWEAEHGRPCLPAMFLHPLKNVRPTEPGHISESHLPYS